MISVDYRKSSYRLTISNLLNSENNDLIMFKFDTGAVQTIISIEALLDDIELENIDKNRIKITFENKFKTHIKTVFKSASGTDMAGYLCKSRNVLVDETEFKEFFYYLTFDTNRKLALLGDDFISCCDFVHSAGNDILIRGFDRARYTGQHKSGSITNDEISLAFLETVKK